MNGHNGDSSGANKNSSNTSIHLYAEFLKNIGTVSIQAHLPTVSNNATKATLSASHHQFNLSHDGEFVSIQLPTRVSHDINQATLTIPATPSKDLSFRLKVEEKPSGNELRRNGISNAENIMPWMASDLTPETEMYCAYCGSKLIGRGSVKRWKDLPSEGWAEMMDLWHCHKPHEPNGRENSGGVSRGIGGESKLAIEIGVGLVSPLDLIFATDDCMGIEPIDTPTTEAYTIQCCRCHAPMGSHGSGTEHSYRIRKSRLSVSLSLGHPSVSYPLEQWLAGYIVQAAEFEGVQRFTVSSPAMTPRSLKLWIFNSDITISSSEAHEGRYCRVLKLLWQDCEVERSKTSELSRAGLSESDIELPEIDQLHELLKTSATLLPDPARKLGHWNVAILQRFSQGDGLN